MQFTRYYWAIEREFKHRHTMIVKKSSATKFPILFNSGLATISSYLPCTNTHYVSTNGFEEGFIEIWISFDCKLTLSLFTWLLHWLEDYLRAYCTCVTLLICTLLFFTRSSCWRRLFSGLSCCLFLFSNSLPLSRVFLNSKQSNTVILIVMILNAFFGHKKET